LKENGSLILKYPFTHFLVSIKEEKQKMAKN